MLTVSYNIDGGNDNDNAKNKNFGRMKENSRTARAARTLNDSTLFSAKQEREKTYRICV